MESNLNNVEEWMVNFLNGNENVVERNRDMYLKLTTKINDSLPVVCIYHCNVQKMYEYLKDRYNK